jgi:WD40 repeat protein
VAPGASDAGVLPLLSHALYATWRHGQGRRLTIACYWEVGGIDGAVAASAGKVYDELTDRQRELARRLFLSLVHVTTDTADTRRTVPTAELLAEHSAEDAGEIEDVLDRFVAQRLVTAYTDTVQISHEALLTAWPTLRTWLDTDRTGLVIGQQLATAAVTWRRENRDPAALYGGTRLAAAQGWAAEHRPELPTPTAEFLDASMHHARRRMRTLYQLVAALTALVVVASVLAGYAFDQRAAARTQREDALSQRNQALSRLVAGRAERLRGLDVSLAMQLSLAAYRTAPTVEARSSVLDSHAAPAATRLRGFATAAQSVAFSPDKRLLAAGSLDHTVRLWDTSDPRRSPVPAGPPLTGPSLAVFSVAFSPGGRVLAAAGGDKTVHLWDVADPRRPVAWRSALTGPASTVYSVTFSPTGRVVAAGSADNRVWLWDVSDPGRPRPLAKLTGPSAAVQSVAFSPNGHTLAAGSADTTVRLWDLTNPARPIPVGPPLTGHTLKVYSVAFSPDGRTLAAGGADKTVRLWNIADPRRPIPLRAPLTGPTSWVNSVAFSPDGHTLAAGSSDKVVTTWDLATRHVTATLPHPTPVTAVIFGRDQNTLATSSTDATIRLWGLPGPTLTGPTDAIFNAPFSPDGHTLAVASRDETVQLWDVRQPRRPAAHPHQDRRPRPVSSVQPQRAHPGGRQLRQHHTLVGPHPPRPAGTTRHTTDRLHQLRLHRRVQPRRSYPRRRQRRQDHTTVGRDRPGAAGPPRAAPHRPHQLRVLGDVQPRRPVAGRRSH